MISIPKALILRGPGTNCDMETTWALELSGAKCEPIHINVLMKQPSLLRDFHLLVLPGGFTYGDDISAGAVFAVEIREFLGEELKAFIESGKLVVGICNGFQILIKSGFLPGGDLDKKTTLFFNDSAKFESRWILLKKNKNNLSPFLSRIPDILPCPVAHAEGKFMATGDDILDIIEENNQVAFIYVDEFGNTGDYPINPNGSMNHIAGITDSSGRVLGLMPHPERNIFARHHPKFRISNVEGAGAGMQFFEGAVEYIKREL